MVKIKQSPKLPAEERREQLLLSAQKLFAEKGYKETTTNEIAKAAKLTKGALYFHFKNKEEILFELVKHVAGHFKQLVEDNREMLRSPRGYVKLVLDAHKGEGEHCELTHSLDFWLRAFSVTRTKKFMIEHFNEMLIGFGENVDDAYARTKGEKRQLGLFTFSFIDGLIMRQIVDPESINANAQLKLFDVLLEGLLIVRKKQGKGSKK